MGIKEEHSKGKDCLIDANRRVDSIKTKQDAMLYFMSRKWKVFEALKLPRTDYCNG